MRQLVHTMFLSNNGPSFHLWWKENLVKHWEVSKYYETDCRLKSFLLSNTLYVTLTFEEIFHLFLISKIWISLAKWLTIKFMKLFLIFRKKNNFKRLHKISICLKELRISKQMHCLDSCSLEHCSNLQFDSLDSWIFSWGRQTLWLYEVLVRWVLIISFIDETLYSMRHHIAFS